MADQLKAQLDVVKGKINELLDKHPHVQDKVQLVSDKVGVEKAYVVIGAVVIPILILLAVGSGALIGDAIGFAYPMYQSLKALETEDKEDDKQWLTYWLIFSLFKVAESIAGVLLEMIPFYFFIKLAFLIWCYYPATKGASVVYSAIVKPYLVPALGIEKGSAKKD